MINSHFNNKTVEDFFKYLQSRGIAKNTFRFYRSDFLHFERWLKDYFAKNPERKIDADSFYDYIPYLTTQIVQNYITFLKENKTPIKTINRRLSTIRHLSNYLQMYGYTNVDITQNIENTNIKKLKEQQDIVVKDVTPTTKTPYVIAASFVLLSLALITILLANNKDLLTTKDARLSSNLETKSNPLTFNKTININTDDNRSNLITTVLSDTSEYFDEISTLSNKGTIMSNQLETTINHPLINRDMLIYLTPVTSTHGQTIYIDKVDNGFFTVRIDEFVNEDIHFNWLGTVSGII